MPRFGFKGAKVNAVANILGWTAGIGLLTMVVVTLVDVVGRYLFNRPLPSGHALVQALVFGAVFLGLPLLSAQRGYMRVELLDSALPPPLTRWRNVAIDWVTAACLLTIGLQFLWHGRYYADRGEYIEILEIPLAVFGYGGGGLSLVAALLTATRTFVDPKSPTAAESAKFATTGKPTPDRPQSHRP